MCKFIILSLFLSFILIGFSNCTSSYDQRQTGDLNVQIGLKNIQLIALLKGGKEEYVDYDYAYDYSEMTIKPPKSTTSKPLNVTDSQNNATVTSTMVAENATDLRTNVTESILSYTTNGPNAAVGSEETMNITANNATIVNSSTEPSSTMTTAKNVVDYDAVTVSPDASSTTSDTSTVSSSKCRRGFAQNNQGKCEFKVHGTTNALRRIVKLAQKIKIGREYKGT